jgi:hypothetical protein
MPGTNGLAPAERPLENVTVDPLIAPLALAA